MSTSHPNILKVLLLFSRAVLTIFSLSYGQWVSFPRILVRQTGKFVLISY